MTFSLDHFDSNMEFYERMRKYGLAPVYIYACKRCGSGTALVNNRIKCQNTHCNLSYDLWENTPLEGYPSLCWDQHY